jgi:hypothetical protein
VLALGEVPLVLGLALEDADGVDGLEAAVEGAGVVLVSGSTYC